MWSLPAFTYARHNTTKDRTRERHIFLATIFVLYFISCYPSRPPYLPPHPSPSSLIPLTFTLVLTPPPSSPSLYSCTSCETKDYICFQFLIGSVYLSRERSSVRRMSHSSQGGPAGACLSCSAADPYSYNILRQRRSWKIVGPPRRTYIHAYIHTDTRMYMRTLRLIYIIKHKHGTDITICIVIPIINVTDIIIIRVTLTTIIIF